MYSNNGKFIKDILVGEKIYITDHKHIAIFGSKDYTGFGESSVNSYMYGKDVGITADNKFFADSNAGSNLSSKQYVHIESGSSTPNHGSDNGAGVEIVSKNGNAVLSSEGNNSTTVKSTNYVNLNSGKGVTVNNISYGTTLPSTGIEGQIFFKLIS